MGKLEISWPQLNYLAIYGLWPVSVGGIRFRKVQWLWGRLIVTLTVMVIVLEIVNLHELLMANEMDLNDFVITMNDILYATQSICILVNILVYKKQFAIMMDELGEMLDHSQLLMKSYAEHVFTKKLRVCRFAFIAFLSGTLLMAHWGISPLLNRILYHRNTFVYHVWIPFDVEPWYIYFSVLTAQITIGVSWIMGQPMFASLFISISEHLLGHFDVLRQGLETLDYSAPSASQEVNRYFEYHQKILKVGYILRSATKLVFLSQFLCVTSIMCLNLYEITYVDVETSRFLNMVEYTLLELLIIALYCSYCNELTLRGSEIMSSAYFSGWESASIQDRKSLWIFMTSTKAPLNYGGMVKMDWTTFVNILKTAFSFYNFLGAVRTSKEGQITNG
uniref:Odorant receptor n=1 Tax=Adelphocoris lineolatus TaxID=236346 RepID=A0A2I4PHM9_ADELI|nr:olfactory receptor 74 [Adelphocoris lineolatus]